MTAYRGLRRVLSASLVLAAALGAVVLTRDLGGPGAGEGRPSSGAEPVVPSVAARPVASLEEFCGGVQAMANARAAQMTTPNEENRTALERAVTRWESTGLPEGLPAAAAAAVRMMVEDARRTGRGQEPLGRSEAEELAYERLGEFLTERCDPG